MNAEDLFYRRYDQVKKIVTQRPGISKSDLTFATNSFKGFERNEIIDAMLNDGEIEEEVTRTGKRPRTNYWPWNHPASPSIRQLAQEVANDPDTTQMTNEQIKSFNERRQAFNRHLVSIDCYPLEMLVAT